MECVTLRQSKTFFEFDTVNTITVFGSDRATLDEAAALCARLGGLFSRFLPGSDIGRVNLAQGKAVEVSPETLAILREAVAVGEATEGCFDITSRAGTKGADYRRIELGDGTVRVPDGVQLDLGGIAKGYAADAVASMLRDAGVRSALINLGGNIYALGRNPGGAPWRVGIQTPGKETGTYCAAVDVADMSVVTSGIYERGRFENGVWKHHILNPLTGQPADSGLVSVTVIGASSTLCDALATAFVCMGAVRAKDVLRRVGRDMSAVCMDGKKAVCIGKDMPLIGK